MKKRHDVRAAVRQAFFLVLAQLAAADYLTIDKAVVAPLETVTLTVSDVNDLCSFSVLTPAGHLHTFGGSVSGGICTASYTPSYMTGVYEVSALRDGEPTVPRTFTVGTADWGDQIHLVEWQVSPTQYFAGEPIVLDARLQNNAAGPLTGFSKVFADTLPNRSAGGMYIQRKVMRIEADGTLVARLFVYFDTTGAPNLFGNNYAHIYAGTQVVIGLYGGDGVSAMVPEIGVTAGFFNNADGALASSLAGNQWTVDVTMTMFQQDKIAYLDFAIPPTRSLSDVTFSVDAIQYNYNSGIGDYIHIGETAIASGAFPAGNTFTTGFLFSSLGRFPIRLPLNPRPAGLVYYHIHYADFPGHGLNDGTVTGTGGVYSNNWTWKRPVETTATVSFFADKWGYRGALGQALALTAEPPTRESLFIDDYHLDLPFYTEGETRLLSATLKDESQNPVTGFRTQEAVVNSTAGKLSIVSQNVRTDENGNAVVRLLIYFDASGSSWSNIYAGTQVEISLYGPDGISGIDPNILIQEGGINTEGYIVTALNENEGVYDWVATVQANFVGTDRQVYLDVIIPPGHSPSEVVYCVSRIVYRFNHEWADQISIKNTVVNMNAFPPSGTWNTYLYDEGDIFGNLGYFPLYLSLNPNDRGLTVRMDGGVETAVSGTLQATAAGLYSYSHTWTGDAGPDYQTQMCFSRYGYFGNKALCSETETLYFSGEPRYLGGLTDTPVLLGSTWEKDLNAHFFVDRDFELVAYTASDARISIDGSIARYSPADLDATISGLVLTASSTSDPSISVDSPPFTLYAANCLSSTDCEDIGQPCKCIQYQCRYYEPVKNYELQPQGCDLSIFNQDVTMTTVFPLPGQEVQIQADVYNKGTTYAYDVEVTFYLDAINGTVIDVNTLTVVPITYGLLPFRSERAVVNWTVPDHLTGPHRIWVKVEGTCPGIDSEEMLSNNYATLDFFVVDPDMHITDPALVGGCSPGTASMPAADGLPDMPPGTEGNADTANPAGDACETVMIRIPITVQVCENELRCAPVTGYEHGYWSTWYWPSWSGYCQHFDVTNDAIWALIVTYEVAYGIFNAGPAAFSPSLSDGYDLLKVPYGWGTGHLPCHPEPTLFQYNDYGGISNPGCGGLCPVSAWDCGQGVQFKPKFDSPYYHAYEFPIISGGARTVTRCKTEADSVEIPYQICYPLDNPGFNLPFTPFGGGLNGGGSNGNGGGNGSNGGYGPGGVGPAGSGPGGGAPMRFGLGSPMGTDGSPLDFECYFCGTGGTVTTLSEDIIHCFATPPYNEVMLRKGWNMWAVTLDPVTVGEDSTIALYAGWNLFGFSSPEPFDWSLATVSDGVENKSVAQAHADGWLQGTIYYRDAGMQVTRFVPGDDDALRPNKGYWLYAAQNGLVLTLPGVGGASVGSTLQMQAVMVVYNGQTLTLSDAQTAGWLDSRIYAYDAASGTYALLDNPEDFLKPWTGYLVQSVLDGVRLVTGPAPEPASQPMSPQQAPYASLAGEPAPGFVLPDMEGGVFSFTAPRNRGVLLVFGNTTCPICRSKIPLLNRLTDQAAQNELDVIFVAVGATRDSALRFIAEHDVRCRVLLDSRGQTARRYGVHAVPEAFLVDPTGRIQHGGAKEKVSLWRLLE